MPYQPDKPRFRWFLPVTMIGLLRGAPTRLGSPILSAALRECRDRSECPLPARPLSGQKLVRGAQALRLRHAQSGFIRACAPQASHRGIRNESTKKSISSRTFGETCLRVG